MCRSVPQLRTSSPYAGLIGEVEEEEVAVGVGEEEEEDGDVGPVAVAVRALGLTSLSFFNFRSTCWPFPSETNAKKIHESNLK